MSLPSVQVRIPSSNNFNRKIKKKSWIRTVVEIFLFILWLAFTGISGYYFGHGVEEKCPDTKENHMSQVVSTPLIPEVKQEKTSTTTDCNPNTSSFPLEDHFPEEGYSISELKSLWSCPYTTNDGDLNRDLASEIPNLKQTKWKSIIKVDPKPFFEKYLTQYPGDTRATQPVVVFSHKPLNNFEELTEVCKVLDIAIVPDKPGVCVAVTETYHDVASYHMLHADRQTDGSFALTGNFIDGRKLPTEAQYAAARALILDYFKYNEIIQKKMDDIPKFSNGKVIVGALIEDPNDVELFLNSLASAKKAGINANKFVVFTTSSHVQQELTNVGCKIIYLPELTSVGTQGDANIGAKYRRNFLQAWLSFTVANHLIKMLWQSPGTIWFDRPDNIANKYYPSLETLWSFHGRQNNMKSAPFFVSFDFFIAVGVERPVHFLHELILHFDLVLAWESLDAVASYRLTENNSRYGTTLYVMPPYQILHSEVMNHDPNKLKEAIEQEDVTSRPYVIIIPKFYDEEFKEKMILKQAGLWFLP